MASIKIFIWQSSIDHHGYYTWLALASLLTETKEEVTFVLEQEENDIRKGQGWKAVDLNKAKCSFYTIKKAVEGREKID